VNAVARERKICVYCGSKPGADGIYASEAASLGTAIAQSGFGMVYGGGNVGLMGITADSVLAAGGQVVGVIPHALKQRELAHQGLTELLVVDDMHERKALMADRADAFITLPGGYGTLEELFEALAWSQLGIHQKPVGLLNTAGYFDHLLAFLDHAVKQEFLRDNHRTLLQIERDPRKLVENLIAAIDR
jgi:uncharacterized protein (TIGR00730 family)